MAGVQQRGNRTIGTTTTSSKTFSWRSPTGSLTEASLFSAAAEPLSKIAARCKIVSKIVPGLTSVSNATKKVTSPKIARTPTKEVGTEVVLPEEVASTVVKMATSRVSVNSLRKNAASAEDHQQAGTLSASSATRWATCLMTALTKGKAETETTRTVEASSVNALMAAH